VNGVRALKANPRLVQDANIRRLIESGASDQEVLDAISSSTQSRVSSGEGVDAAGAGETSADRAGMEGTEAMIAAITEGMEDFPGAVNQLSEASRELTRAARVLQGASDLGSVAGMLQGGSGDSNGLAVGAAAAIPIFGPALSALLR
jgi:adenine-specific DNA methylase